MSSQGLLFYGLSAFRRRNKQAQKNDVSHHMKHQPYGFPLNMYLLQIRYGFMRKKIALHKK